MVLSERGMKLAKELAREIVIVENNKEHERIRLERERRARETRQSFESLGRAIRKAQDAYMEGFYKPINNALKAMNNGYHN